uniref:Uncharacterized protein n=1 Tax=viral metagenome TaxID=1070528 RepID=A0A6C0J5M2_9ZZZZ
MYLNSIDNFFDGVLDNFHNFINKKKFIEQISKDDNFVKYHNNILDIIKEFIDIINKETIKEIKSKEQIIFNICKRYCAYYIYFSISYNYKESRDLFITNLLESTKNQKSSNFQIENFYNSENNSKIIKIYSIIKNILELQKFKTMERIKIILENNPIKYNDTIEIFNLLGEDFITDFFLIKDNFHNILKTIIFKVIYENDEKNNIITLLNESEMKNSEYKYIEIIVSTKTKLLDFPFFQSILTVDDIKKGKDKEYYSYLEENKEEEEKFYSNKAFLNFIFSNKLLVPITEEFIRYHKNTEKYDKKLDDNIKDRDSTKIKYVINKINKLKNLHSKFYDKNPKMKLDAKELFYKPLLNREVVLYNDSEEVKIIQKLELSEQTTDLDYLVDLENSRNYAYLNYKDYSKDGFTLRTTKQVQSIRYTNIKNFTDGKIELRVGHNNLPFHTVGIVFNPFGSNLECFTMNDIENVSDKYNKNGYKNLIKKIKTSFTNKLNDKTLYYWLFDNKNDIIELDEYKNVSSINKSQYIETLIVNLFNIFYDIISEYIINKIKSINNLDIYTLNYNIRKYSKKFFGFNNLNIKLKHTIYPQVLNIIFKEIEIKKEIEIPNIIKLPESKYIKLNDKTIISLKQDKVIIESTINRNTICSHYLKWIKLGKLSRNDTELLNQEIFNFVKQYVKTNEEGVIICKSCNEMLNIKKYVYEGTYVKELDTFQTTNLAVSQNLEKIPKYNKFTRTIRNLEKNLEKICYTINLNYYIGNIPTIKLRRKMVIKDVIDLILIHTKYIKDNSKDRAKKNAENYNINKDLTNLFFFELKDDIFLTSSTETDYYKLIKYNNVLSYVIFIIITDINVGQILNFKDDKKCNYFIYDKIGKNIFDNLFIRISDKIKILIKNIPLLGYVIFYLSCILTNSYIWLWNKENKNENYNIQKIIIHTLVDLINSIMEANLEKKKNFIYELIVNRFTHKLKHVYNDKNILTKLEEESMNKIKIDEKTNKISYITKKEKILELSGKFDETYNMLIYNELGFCNTILKTINEYENLYFDNNITNITNCNDGYFHNWEFKNNELICKKCNEKYSVLFDKKYSTNDIRNNIKYNNLKKLAIEHCLSGDTHDFEPGTKQCLKCKINIDKKQYTNNELLKLEKNINEKKIKIYQNQIENNKLYFQNKEKNKIRSINILKNLKNRYIKSTNNKLINYIDDFIDRLKSVLGDKVKLNDRTILLKDTKYTIMNDYLGNEIKNKFSILSSDNKIKFNLNHSFFKRDVLYYNDQVKNVFVYYDNLTKNYIGYSKDNREFKTFNSTSYIKVKYSLRDMLINLGLENKFVNIYNLNDDYKNKNFKMEDINHKTLLKDLIRYRVNNLNFIISKSKILLEKINNNNNNKFTYNSEDKLIEQINKQIKTFKTVNKEGRKKIFKHIDIVRNINNIENNNIKLTISKNYINTDILNTLNNNDNFLIYYYIMNLNRFLSYNSESISKTNSSLTIVKIILHCFNLFYLPLEDSDIRKFNSILITDTPYINPSLQVSGYYQELVNSNEIDDEKISEQNYDINEETSSYEVNSSEIQDVDELGN